MRIVSLACSNTEIACALGAADELVGVDDHSDYPSDVVARLPRVGPDLSVDIERVRALKPDLVLASLTVPGHERNIEQLERAGIPFVAPEPRTLADVYANIRELGALLGRTKQAELLVSHMQSELEPRPVAPHARLLLEWWPKPIIAPGRDSWVNEVFAAAGASNPLADRPVKSTPVTDEEAAALAPDAVIISWCGVRVEKYRPEVVLRRPAFQSLRLVAERRVYPISEAFLGRPGPRLVDGARALRAVVDALSS